MKMMRAALVLLVLYVATVSQATLVHQYDVDEGSGTTLDDEVGANDGAITGNVVWESSGPANGTSSANLRFGGLTADHVYLASPITSDNVTIAFWAKAHGGAAHAGDVLMSNHDGSQADYYEIGFGIGGNLFFRCNTSGGQVFAGDTAAADPFTATEFGDFNWHHFAATYDGASAKLYVDGALVESLALSGTVANNGTMMIGRRPHVSSAAYDGRLGGQVLIYDNALSATEIAALLHLVPGSNLLVNGDFEVDPFSVFGGWNPNDTNYVVWGTGSVENAWGNPGYGVRMNTEDVDGSPDIPGTVSQTVSVDTNTLHFFGFDTDFWGTSISNSQPSYVDVWMQIFAADGTTELARLERNGGNDWVSLDGTFASGTNTSVVVKLRAVDNDWEPESYFDNVFVSPPGTASVPTLTIEHLAGVNSNAISWNADSWLTYTLQSKSNLTDSIWTDSITNIPGAAGGVVVTTGVDQAQTFYRVESE